MKTLKTAGTSIETYLSSRCASSDVFTPFGIKESGHTPRNFSGVFNPLPELSATGVSSFRQTCADLAARRRFYNHMSAMLLKCRVPEEIWKRYFKFCVERNPWEKTLSHYYFLKNRFKKNISLDEYFDQGQNCLNWPLYTDPKDDSLLVDRVLRYENLSTELAEVFSKLGIEFDGSLGVNAKSNYRSDRRSYRDVLNDRQRDKIARLHACEISLLNYEF